MVFYEVSIPAFFFYNGDIIPGSKFFCFFVFLTGSHLSASTTVLQP